MAESNAGPEGDLGNDAQGPNGPPNDPHGGGASVATARKRPSSSIASRSAPRTAAR